MSGGGSLLEFPTPNIEYPTSKAVDAPPNDKHGTVLISRSFAKERMADFRNQKSAEPDGIKREQGRDQQGAAGRPVERERGARDHGRESAGQADGKKLVHATSIDPCLAPLLRTSCRKQADFCCGYPCRPMNWIQNLAALSCVSSGLL
jgi:hypothetical protein